MYKKMLLFLGLAALAASCSDNYTIQGTIDKMTDGSKILLQKQVNEIFVPVDSTLVKNGEFSFKGKQDTATMAIITVEDRGKYPYPPLVFILENGKLKMNIDTIPGVTGTGLNDKFTAFMKSRTEADKKMDQLSRSYVSSYISGALTDSAFTDLKKQFADAETGLRKMTQDYVHKNTDNISGVYVFIQNSYLFTPEEQLQIIKGSKEFFRQNPIILTLSKILDQNKNVAVGMPYIDLKMQNPEGKSVSLSEYIGKGKYVLIDFWASWCAPCRKEMPVLMSIYERFKNKPFEIVGVSFDNNKEEWIKYIRENEIPWPQMSDMKGWESEAIMLYAIQGIPHTVLVDPKGKIIAKDLKEEELVATLNKVL